MQGICAIAFGAPPCAFTAGSEKAELDKRIASELMQAVPMSIQFGFSKGIGFSLRGHRFNQEQDLSRRINGLQERPGTFSRPNAEQQIEAAIV